MKKLIQACLIILMLAPVLAAAQGLIIPDDRRITPPTIRYHRVAVDIQEGTAVIRIEQAFVNNSPQIMEATYVFPVPRGAAVADFSMLVNGKQVRGEILEKSEAARIYQQIVSQLRDPGLLEHLQGELFRARVFPIQPGKEQQVTIVLNQILACDDGSCSYLYPLNDKGVLKTEEDFTLAVEIRSKTPIRGVYSPTHKVSVAQPGEHRAVVGLEEDRANLNRDFELVYTVSQDEIGLSVLSSKPSGKDGFFLLLVSPPAEVKGGQVPKDITFIVDTSGSMAGAKMDYAKRALTTFVEQLTDKDRFNIVRFSTDVSRLSETHVYAKPEMKRQAREFIDGLSPIGGTNIDGALITGLRFDEPANGRSRLVVFLTDGKPTVGQTDIESIVKAASEVNRQKARLFAFGVGSEINTLLLDRLTLENGGTSRYVKPGQEIETALASFYRKIASPVMTGLTLSMGGSGAYDLYPSRLPDLFAGDQLVVLGRYKQAGRQRISLAGVRGDDQRSVSGRPELADSTDNRGLIEKMWATRKVGYLLEQVRLHGEDQELTDQIVKLAMTYGIVTPYTSYLIQEEQPLPPRGPRPIPMPLTDESAFQPAPHEEQSMSMPKGDFMDSSGAGAVRASQGVATMKEKKIINDVPGALFRYRAGRAFTLTGGVWTDSTYKEGYELLEIKVLGDAYFKLLAKKPELAEVLALGDKILVVTGNRKAILVSDQGEDQVKEQKLDFFLR